MSRDIYYSKLYNDTTKCAPKITDMDALQDVLSNEPYSKAIDKAAFGESRENDSYPAKVYKTLHGFQYYDADLYLIPELGFDPNFQNEQFLDFWEPISEHTESFSFWLRNGASFPVELHPGNLNTTEDVFQLTFANGELVEAEQHTLGTVETIDVTADTQEND